MRYYVPDIRSIEELPPQSKFEEKLGGLPWGLPKGQWPNCKECGKSQSLLAQFIHEPPRLDLGRDGRVMSVFQCNHDPGMCSSWEGGSGANACFISEPEDLMDGPTPLPTDEPLIEREARIMDWIVRNDKVCESSASNYFSEDKYLALGREGWRMPSSGTKLGSVPSWLQSPDEAPKDGWRFVGQLDSTYSFYSAPAADLPHVSADLTHWEGRSHMCEGPNLGDGGIAYLFFRESGDQPEGWFFWQCG